MHISELLTPDRITSSMQAGSRKRTLELVSEVVANCEQNLNQQEIFSSLIGREKLGSTGIGHGVALPHGRVAGTKTAIGVFVKLQKPIEFDSIDNEPVDLIFALVVPENSEDQHLLILAQLAQMFSNREFCAKLRVAADDATLLELLNSWEPDTSPY